MFYRLVARIISTILQVDLIISPNWRIEINNQKKRHFVLAVRSAGIRVGGSRFYMLRSKKFFLLLIDTVKFKLMMFIL